MVTRFLSPRAAGCCTRSAYHLAAHLSLADIAHLEHDLPGLSAALSEWVKGMDGE